MIAAIPTDTPYPFTFDASKQLEVDRQTADVARDVTVTIPNVRGRLPSEAASRLRSMLLEAQCDPSKVLAQPCSYDGLTSRLVEEAGFPLVFLSGYTVASTHGLPDTGYVAMQEMCDKIQEVARQVSVPIFVDGDTGYGSPMNVKRTVESFALAGAAGVMIEDQTWPKRCGHTKGKTVVSREEAFARIRAAVDAREQGKDIVIMGRTDSLIMGFDEAIYRAKEYKRLGVDVVFVEALPDKPTMQRCLEAVDMPMMANIIEGGLTENLSAQELAAMGFSMVSYPFTLVAAKLQAVRNALEGLKASMLVGPPPMIMSATKVCDGVGFPKYWEMEGKYAYETVPINALVKDQGIGAAKPALKAT